MSGRTINIVVLGAAGTGKSVFAHRHKTGEFEKKYVPTSGVSVVELPFYTNQGVVNVRYHDTAGQEKYAAARVSGPIDAAFVFFSLDSQISLREAKYYYQQVKDLGMPVVLLGGKCDVKEPRVNREMIRAWLSELKRGGEVVYYDVSGKSNYNFEKPFLAVLRALMGVDVKMVEAPAVWPPIVGL